MTSAIIQDYHKGNGKYDNKKFVLDTDETVTLEFRVSGIDNGDTKFYNLGDTSSIAILVNKVATITKIDNKTLTAPLTLGTDSWNVFKKSIGSIVVRADVDTTAFEIFAVGG